MTEEPRPTIGDLADFIHPKSNQYRFGRVVKREGNTLTIKQPSDRRGVRVEVGNVLGWWPKGARNRGPEHRRIPEVA